MEFILSPKTSTIPDDEISLETLSTIWNNDDKHALLRELNGHQTDIYYTMVNQDTFLGHVYGNILYFHTSVVPQMVKGWSDEKLVGFYNEDDLDEIADNFTKEFNALIGSKPYKIKKHVVLTRALEDRFLELLTLFPSKELIGKLNFRVQENRVNHVLQIQPALRPATYFDYRMGSAISGLESHLKFMTLFTKRIKDYLELYQPECPEAVDYLNFIIKTRSHFLDSALQYYFATAVLNHDEIHYIFDLSSDHINHSMKFSNKRIGEVEEIRFKSDLTPTFILNLAIDLIKLTYVMVETESFNESVVHFKRQINKVLNYFSDDKKLLNSYNYRNDRMHITPYTTIRSSDY